MNSCPHLERIIKIAESEGNKILSVSTSDLMDHVLWMNNQLSTQLRDEIFLDLKNLEYKKSKDMPHDPATEYFICKECKTVVVFPMETAK